MQQLKTNLSQTESTGVSAYNNQQNISVNRTDQINTNKQDNSLIIIIILLVVITLLLIGTAFMFILYKENNSEKNINQDEIQPTAEEIKPTTINIIENFGFIIDSFQQDGKNYLKIKTAKMITIDDPEYLTFCGGLNEECPNDYYIDSSSSELLELIVDDNSQINVIFNYFEDCSLNSEGDSFKTYSIKYNELIDSNCSFTGISSYIPFEFTYQGNILKEATQFYIP